MNVRMLSALTVLLLAAFGFCAYRYYGDVIAPEQALAEADAAQSALFAQIRPTQPAAPSATDETAPEPSAPAAAETQPDALAPAEAVNAAVVGWITIPGTQIDYPIVQGEDNTFYLHHGFDGKPNQELGCPFLDCRCEADFTGLHSIVYAHHMTKQRMFADVARFKEQAFLEQHQTGCLTTHSGTHTVRFFAYLNVPDDAAIYALDETPEQYAAYLTQAAVYCLLPAEDIQDCRLLLLSTCTFEFDGARGVLAGVIQ